MIEPTSEQLAAELEESAREILERREKALFDEIWKEGFLEWAIQRRLNFDVSQEIGTRMSMNVDYPDFLAWRKTVEK